MHARTSAIFRLRTSTPRRTISSGRSEPVDSTVKWNSALFSPTRHRFGYSRACSMQSLQIMHATASSFSTHSENHGRSKRSLSERGFIFLSEHVSTNKVRWSKDNVAYIFGFSSTSGSYRKQAVQTGLHLACSLPMPFCAAALSRRCCPLRSLHSRMSS